MHTCHHFRALPEFHRGVAHHNYCMSLMLATNIYRNLTPSSSLLLLIQDLGLGLLRFLFAHIVSFNSRISFCYLSHSVSNTCFSKRQMLKLECIPLQLFPPCKYIEDIVRTIW